MSVNSLTEYLREALALIEEEEADAKAEGYDRNSYGAGYNAGRKAVIEEIQTAIKDGDIIL